MNAEPEADTLPPFFEISLLTWAHPEYFINWATRETDTRKKYMAQGLRRDYLEETGEYNMGQLPDPLPAPRNTIGICAET